MNKLMIALALCAALAACKKDDAAAPAPADSAAAPAAASSEPAPADTAPAPAATAAVNSGLPQECEDYMNRAKACFAKANPQMAAAYQSAIDQSKAQWDAMTDKSGLSAACKAANDQFAQTASMLKCE